MTHFEKMALAVIKETNSYVMSNYKGFKIIEVKHKEAKECGYGHLEVFTAICKFSAKKYEDNRAEYSINIYEDGSVQAFFEREYYEA